MNRIVAFILIIIYVTFTSGLLVNVHYCMGKVASVRIESTAAADACNACEQRATMSCCNDHLTVLKVNDAHIGVVNESSMASVASILLSVFTSNLFADSNIISDDIILSNISPPPRNAPEIFLRNCNFRI